MPFARSEASLALRCAMSELVSSIAISTADKTQMSEWFQVFDFVGGELAEEMELKACGCGCRASKSGA